MYFPTAKDCSALPLSRGLRLDRLVAESVLVAVLDSRESLYERAISNIEDNSHIPEQYSRVSVVGLRMFRDPVTYYIRFQLDECWSVDAEFEIAEDGIILGEISEVVC